MTEKDYLRQKWFFLIFFLSLFIMACSRERVRTPDPEGKKTAKVEEIKGDGVSENTVAKGEEENPSKAKGSKKEKKAEIKGGNYKGPKHGGSMKLSEADELLVISSEKSGSTGFFLGKGDKSEANNRQRSPSDPRPPPPWRRRRTFTQFRFRWRKYSCPRRPDGRPQTAYRWRSRSNCQRGYDPRRWPGKKRQPPSCLSSRPQAPRIQKGSASVVGEKDYRK